MRGRGCWRTGLPAGVVVLLVARLDRRRCQPGVVPGDGRGRPDTLSAPAAPGSTTVDALATAVVEAQATAEAEAAAEVAASAEAVTSAVGAVDAIAEEAGVWVGVAVLDRVTGEIAVGAEGATPIAAASLTKLYTVVDVLDRATAGEIVLTDADLRDRAGTDPERRQRHERALEPLRRRGHGGGAVAAAGLQDSGPPSDRRSGGRRWCRRVTSWCFTTTC